MADDWFRSPGWSLEAQADFEARLERSRDWNHAQHIRIRAWR